MTLAVCPVSCHCLCSVGLWQSVLPYKVVWQLQPPVEMKVLSVLKVALKGPLSEQSIFLLSGTSCKDEGSAPWKHWDGEGQLLKSCIRRESRLGGVGRVCFLPSLSPFHLRHGYHWLLLSLGLCISPVATFHGSKQACLFSAVLKLWHWHNTGGQKTGAGSMWYLVSVIFCNTYALPVAMAEVSALISHLIHLVSPCCMFVWIKMELCALGPIISKVIAMFDRSRHIQSVPSFMQITYPAWLSANGFCIPHN